MKSILSSLALLVKEAKSSESSSGYEASLEVLEKAHLLTQPFAKPHLYVHWLMLRLALKHGMYKEFFGQIPRLILAMPGSWTGKAPRGNLGSTKMGIFEER